MELKTILKEYRNRAGMTQESMAKVMEVTKSAYNHYETGERIPGSDKLLKFMRVLDLPPEALYDPTSPWIHTVSVPANLLKNLDEAIKNNINNIDTSDSMVKEKSLKELRTALRPVIAAKDEFLDFPEERVYELDINKLPSGTEIKRVNLDKTTEVLISQCFKLMDRLTSR